MFDLSIHYAPSKKGITVATITQVSLHVFIRRGGTDRIDVLCQRQGRHDFKKGEGSRPDWEGSLQPAAQGEMMPEDGEDYEQCLFRAIAEELGEEFAELSGNSSYPLVHIVDIRDTRHYGLVLVDLQKEIQRIRLKPSTGGIHIIHEEQFSEMRDVNNFNRNKHIPPDTLAMQPEDATAMVQGWRMFPS